MTSKSTDILCNFPGHTDDSQAKNDTQLLLQEVTMDDLEVTKIRQMKINTLYKEYFQAKKETTSLDKLKRLLNKSKINQRNLGIIKEELLEKNQVESSFAEETHNQAPPSAPFEKVDDQNPTKEITAIPVSKVFQAYSETRETAVLQKMSILPEKSSNSSPTIPLQVPFEEASASTEREGCTQIEMTTLSYEEMDEWDRKEYEWRFKFDPKKARFRVLLTSAMIFMCILLLSIPHVPERVLGIRSPERVLEMFVEKQDISANVTIPGPLQEIHNNSHSLHKRHIPHKFWARARPHNKFKRKKRHHRPLLGVLENGQAMGVKAF